MTKIDGPVVPYKFITNPRFTYVLLFLIVTIVLWIGCNNASKEIVKERAVFSRECAVNLGIIPYLGSKFLVLCLMSTFQVILFMVTIYGVMHLFHALFEYQLPYPGYRLDYGSQFLVLTLLVMNGVALGLLLSASVSTPDRAATLLPYALIPQIILGGGFLIIRDGILYYVAVLFSPTYWAYRAIRTGETELPPDLPIALQYDDSLWIPCLAIIGQTIALLIITYLFLWYQEKKRS